MKYTVSLLLLVAIGHAAEPKTPRSKQEDDDNKTAKRELLAGHYGLRIRPAILEAAIHTIEPHPGYARQEEQKQNVPSQEYGLPKAPQQEYGPPVAKISDVLTGQGPSFPAAIAGHLYSPSPVYQPRLVSPTTFQISQPIPSQLRYSEHKIFNHEFQKVFQPTPHFETLRPLPQLFSITQQENYERQERLRNQNFGLTSRPILSQAFLPRLEPFRAPPVYPQQSIHPIYPLIDEFPRDFFHQINQLGNQLAYNGETIQYIQNEDEQEDIEVKEETEQKIEQQNASQQVQSSTERHQQSSTASSKQNNQQAESYASFSQSLSTPPSNAIQGPPQQILIQPLPSPLPQIQQLPQPQPPVLFQPLPELQPPQLLQPQLPVQPILQPNLQPQLQPLSLLPLVKPLPQLQSPQLLQQLPQQPTQLIQQSTPQPQLQPLPLLPQFQPLPLQPIQNFQRVTSIPPEQLFTGSNQPSQRIGVIRIRQGVDRLTQNQQFSLTQQPQYSSTQQQFSTTPSSQSSFFPQNQQSISSSQPQFSQIQQIFSTPQPQTTSFTGQSQFPSETINQQSFTSSEYPKNQESLIIEQSQFPSISENQLSLASSLPQITNESHKQPSTTAQPLLTNFPQNQQSLTSRQPQFPRTQNKQFSSPQKPKLSYLPQFKDKSTTCRQNLQTSTTRQPRTSRTSQASTLLDSQFVSKAELQLNSLSSELSTKSSRSTSEFSSQTTEITTTPATVSILPKSSSISPKFNSSLQESLSTSSSQIIYTSTLAPSTLPVTQTVTEAPSSTILTSIQTLSTLAPVSHTQPTLPQASRPQPIEDSSQLQNLESSQTEQAISAVELHNQPTILVTPQSLPIQPYPVTIQPILQASPTVTAIPFQQYQPVIQVQQVEQPKPLQIVQVPVKVHLQPTLSPLPQQVEIHIPGLDQQSQSDQQQNKEAAVAHAQELLQNLYTPFLQKPIYSETQAILIQQPHFKAAALAFPSSYSPSFPNFHATPAFSTQYFGKHASRILGHHHPHYHHYRKK